MNKLNKRWVIAESIPNPIEQQLSDYSPVLRQVLYNRGHRTAEAAQRYLQAAAPPGSDPSNLLGMDASVDRIRSAIDHQEKIAIYGDYDVDGVTSTALLSQALESLGGDVRGYIPNRFEEGYGLNIEALKSLREDGVSLVITVDCGIRSLREAEYAREAGLDLIISDHHHPGSELPEAIAIINPKQPGCPYPEKELAGVGLAYKLASALFQRCGWPAPKETYLDLVALGTVADIAPLKNENRHLVRTGLKAIHYSRRQGLVSLIGAAGLRQENISATDIGFGLGPRLNAAGRLDSALAALHLLTSQDVNVTGMLAQQLDDQNRERQRITRAIQEKCEQVILAEKPDALLLFAVDPEFNSGVVGLAASRLTDTYYRPSIVGEVGENYTRASCRSIPELHITEALDQCADLLEHHGGHAAAAGFTVHNDHLPELMERLENIVSAQLADLDLRPVLKADLEIPLRDLKPDILPELDLLQPTGHENPEAIFVSRGLRVVRSRVVGHEGAHLKLAVSDGRITYDAIAFRHGHWYDHMPQFVDLFYTYERNHYNGRITLQLNVKDLKPSGEPD